MRLVAPTGRCTPDGCGFESRPASASGSCPVGLVRPTTPPSHGGEHRFESDTGYQIAVDELAGTSTGRMFFDATHPATKEQLCRPIPRQPAPSQLNVRTRSWRASTGMRSARSSTADAARLRDLRRPFGAGGTAPTGLRRNRGEPRRQRTPGMTGLQHVRHRLGLLGRSTSGSPDIHRPGRLRRELIWWFVTTARHKRM